MGLLISEDIFQFHILKKLKKNHDKYKIYLLLLPYNAYSKSDLKKLRTFKASIPDKDSVTIVKFSRYNNNTYKIFVSKNSIKDNTICKKTAVEFVTRSAMVNTIQKVLSKKVKVGSFSIDREKTEIV